MIAIWSGTSLWQWAAGIVRAWGVERMAGAPWAVPAVEEFNSIIVRATPDGGVVRIKDIARAELGSKSADSLVRYNGRPGDAIAIFQTPGANAVAVAAGVKKGRKRSTAFIPGITGQLYHQFAVAVSVISAINALSLAPALCALLLRHRGDRRGLIAHFRRGIDRGRDGYTALV